MSLQSRLRAIERAARRRRWRGPVKPVVPLEFDLADPATVTFLAEVAEVRGLPVRDRSGGRPIHRMQDQLDVARWIMADPGLARQWLVAIDHAFAMSAVSDTAASEHD